MSRRSTAVVSIGLVLLTGLAYLPVLGNGFVAWDDQEYITENPRIPEGPTAENLRWAFTTFRKGSWHPLTWVSHLADGRLHGLDPRGHHLTSLLLHAASTLLLFSVLRGMTGALWRSGLVAALFALHPLHVESVAWASERKDVLAGFFWVLTMAAYLRHARRPGLPRYLPVIGFLVLALLSKPLAVTLPFALLLLDVWPLCRWGFPGAGGARLARGSVAARGGRLFAEKLPLIALSAALSVVTFYAQRETGYMPSVAANTAGARVGNALLAYGGYLGKTIWPKDLAVFYHYHERLPWQSLPLVAGAALAAVTALCLAFVLARPYLLTGWLWYLGTLVPMIGLVQVGNQGLADRYTYLPLIGIFLAAVWGLAAVPARNPGARRPAAVGAALVLCVLAGLSFKQSGYWRSTVTLFQHAVDVAPDNYKAHVVLGIGLTKEGRTAEANAHFQAALGIHPRAREVHFLLGLNLLGLGRIEEAAGHFLEDLRIDPGNPETHLYLGAIMSRRGDFDAAERHLREAVRLDARTAAAWTGLGLLQARKGAWSEALASFDQALRIDPGDATAQINAREARARLQQGRP
jgi:protein O-mannosyl-transferase